jgi:hypothetical protein
MPVGTVPKAYHVPCITLLYKAEGKLPEKCRMGHHTVLYVSCEDVFTKMYTDADLDFP